MPRGDLMFLSFVLAIADIISYIIPERRRTGDGTETRSNLAYSAIRRSRR